MCIRDSYARAVGELAGAHDVVLVEGAGGLLVELDTRGGTVADLGIELRYLGIGVGVVIVAAPGLGTLNHTALTLSLIHI